MKPWLKELRGRQLEAFLGVWGIKTSQIETTTDLIIDASILFNIYADADTTVEMMADQINALGRKERKRLAESNLIYFIDREPTTSKTEQPITEEALEQMMADSKPQMVDGASQDCVGELDIDPARLLRKVVSAVISHGQGHVLYDFPELLEFMGSRIPHREELAGHTAIDERMFEAKAKWPNLIPGTPV